MTALTSAHRGYEYQDLMVAVRLVDVLLDSIVEIRVDEKLVPDDRFDDLTTVDQTGHRVRTQFKYTDNADQALTLATFTNDARSLRLDRIVSAALEDRNGPGKQYGELSFRIMLPNVLPTDRRLLSVLGQTNPDPGPFVPGINSVRMSFRADALWGEFGDLSAKSRIDSNPFSFLQTGDGAVERPDLDWVCERLVVEVAAPAASLDLTNPGAAEQLLLKRVRNEVGAGIYPNADRSDVDVAEAFIRCARAARERSINITPLELLRRIQLRSDFGAVIRAHPVDGAIEVLRSSTVAKLVQQTSAAADEGKVILLVGPPGQGKSWICQQLVKTLSDEDWIVAEHYCYLGDADRERLPRVLTESIFGSLLGRIAECDQRLVSEQRPRFAAHEKALENALLAAIQNKPRRRVVLVVDGIDHVTRVINSRVAIDPSFALAEALAALRLPPGSTMIVLSQPGKHLDPFETTRAITAQIQPLSEAELRQLAVKLNVLACTSNDSRLSGSSGLLKDEETIGEFVTTLAERSAGNALYATYLCREALGKAATIAEPSVTVHSLPQFDGSLRAYYEHLQGSLGDQSAWVADVIALLDFPVSRSELKGIRPDMAHRVDQAVEVLRPVLSERVTEGGIRIYHESFARFLRLPFQEDAPARKALLDRIIKWLEVKGMFNDSRVFRYLLPTLSEASHDRKVVEVAGRDFVVRSIAAGFPASAIIENLSRAISSAARLGDWPAVVRYVEMSRSAETYQEERFESSMVEFVDVIVHLVGADAVTERLLHDGRPTMAARFGLQMCAALDASGVVAPWREYMRAFLRERKNDNTSYGAISDRKVDIAWLRGRLRLASFRRVTNSNTGRRSVLSGDAERDDRALYASVKWESIAMLLDENELPATDVIQAILDTFGLSTVVDLIDNFSHSGILCLALAEEITEGRVSASFGDSLYWALRAADYGLPPGNTWRLISIGVEVSKIDTQPIDEARKHLLDLTREVQGRSVSSENKRLGEWMDACVIAIRNDPFGLAAAEALLDGLGWYTCWLRFTIALAYAEAAPRSEQSEAGLKAIRILTEVQDPFLGKPRACDLDQIHALINTTIRRAVSLLDDQSWKVGLELLNRVSKAISTTMFGEIGGPVPRDGLLHLAVETATATRRTAAQDLINDEIVNGGGGRFYSDLAEYQLVAARLALKADDSTDAQRHWMEACRLFVAYGWHKDVTLYELLDPLPSLIPVDPARGREAVARVQPLCERVLQHTDGKETRYARSKWWELLAEADPCALSRMIQPRLLSSCNDPNWLLHDARSALWRTWHHRADPILAGILRLTLEESLDKYDPGALELLARNGADGVGHDDSSRLLTALMARFDERPFKYSYSNSDELLNRDRERIEALNCIAARANAPMTGPLPAAPVEPDGTITSGNHGRKSRSISHLPNQIAPMFRSGAVGVAEAIRAWRERRYDEVRSDWSMERFTNALGYRIMELVETGRKGDAEITLGSIADAIGFDDRHRLLKALAEGFERYGQSSLAAMAYALEWTRARGQGGWMTFGGETEIDSLRRATELDRNRTLRTVAAEVEQVVFKRGGTYGVTQALMYGFAEGGLGTTSSISFDIWDEAFAVIADRAPRVAATDDPKDVYVPPDPDDGTDLPGDIDTAFAAAIVAGVAHSGREMKRRSLVATQMLIDEHPSAATTAIESALLSLSDPATLTWLLRVLELTGGKGISIVSTSRNALIELARGPHLTIRALARRLLSDDAIPLAPIGQPDQELLDQGSSGLLLPAGAPVYRESISQKMIDRVAGVRLASAESLLPGLRQAVHTRVDATLVKQEQKHRMRTQFDAYTGGLKERFPDLFLVSCEAVEDAIQRTAAGVRAARLMNHEPVPDPAELEELLAQVLLDDPELPLAVERARQPRPEVPLPPPRGDPLWQAFLACAEGGGADDTSVEAACQKGDSLFGTVAILGAECVPTLAGSVYGGWRLVATVERREISRPDWKNKEEDVAERYRVIELRVKGDRQALTLPPIAENDIQTWHSCLQWSRCMNTEVRSQPVVGCDSVIRVAGDGHHGLGIQRNLLTPSLWLSAALKLKRSTTHFVLEDNDGPAVALITWRTEYETSEYHLAWPRLYGAGLIVRSDAFDDLVHAAQSRLIFRDFIAGPTSLCS